MCSKPAVSASFAHLNHLASLRVCSSKYTFWPLEVHGLQTIRCLGLKLMLGSLSSYIHLREFLSCVLGNNMRDIPEYSPAFIVKL